MSISGLEIEAISLSNPPNTTFFSLNVEAHTLTTFRTIPWNGPFYRSCGFAEWTVDLSEYIEAELAKEAVNGLKDRCAMRLLLQRSGGA